MGPHAWHGTQLQVGPVSDPVVTVDPEGSTGLVKHAVSTASGGGFVAALLAFFQSREKAAIRDRLAVLEGQVAALQAQLDALAPRHLVKLGNQGKRRNRTKRA